MAVDLSRYATPRKQARRQDRARQQAAKQARRALYRSERIRAQRLGFQASWAFEEEAQFRHGRFEKGFVAVVDLRPVTDRSKEAMKVVGYGQEGGADAIRGEQKFEIWSDSPMALGDAFRAALEKAEEVLA